MNVYCIIRRLEFYQKNSNSKILDIKQQQVTLNILCNYKLDYLNNIPLADHRNLFYQYYKAHNGHLINNHLQKFV